MGFGFNLAFMFVILPLCGLLFIFWIFSRKIIFGKILALIISAVIILIMLLSFVRYLTSPMELEKEDYYGSYVIDRNFYPGKQANWQYDHYRFEITSDDSVYFHHTDGNKIVRTDKGKISTVNYHSARLILEMQQPPHHIMAGNPTTYRGPHDFYLVFYSEKFGNVFFRKGDWED